MERKQNEANHNKSPYYSAHMDYRPGLKIKRRKVNSGKNIELYQETIHKSEKDQRHFETDSLVALFTNAISLKI